MGESRFQWEDDLSLPLCTFVPYIFAMASNRAVGRNIHLYGARDNTSALGGLLLTTGMTNKNFYQMVEILLILETSFFLQDEPGTKVEVNDDPLLPGNYYVVGKYIILSHFNSCLILQVLLRSITSLS